MRRPSSRPRRPFRTDGASAVASIGTSLMVAITVALMVVIGMYAFTLVRAPEEAPEVKVNFSQLNDRWTISITSCRGKVDLNALRIFAKGEDGNYVQYDSDGDGVADALLVRDLETIAVASADGPQATPIVFVDVAGDEKLGVGDSLVVYEYYFYPVGALMDADRGYAFVGPFPDAIPLNSTLLLLASPLTLGSPDIHPGDEVQVEIYRGMMPVAYRSGHASASGTYMEEFLVPPAWPTAAYTAVFTVRPGEIDEWSRSFGFHVVVEDPVTPLEAETYMAGLQPLGLGDEVRLVHEPTNSVIVEFRL